MMDFNILPMVYFSNQSEKSSFLINNNLVANGRALIDFILLLRAVVRINAASVDNLYEKVKLKLLNAQQRYKHQLH